MSRVKINTDAVITIANNIKMFNTQMRDEFQTMQRAINQLDLSWDGSAATSAIERFNSIKGDYAEARYDVLDNYVSFMFHQVGEGYEQTEEANVSLASQFK